MPRPQCPRDLVHISSHLSMQTTAQKGRAGRTWQTGSLPQASPGTSAVFINNDATTDAYRHRSSREKSIKRPSGDARIGDHGTVVAPRCHTPTIASSRPDLMASEKAK